MFMPVPRIFISYRRADSQSDTARIYERLDAQFPKDSIFRDIDGIRAGVDFRRVLADAVGSCHVLLAVIGPTWAREHGQRLADPNDFVRLEIENALRFNVLVIPVLVGNANMPAPTELPPPIQQLCYQNAVKVRPDPDFHPDMDRLISELHRFFGMTESSGTRPGDIRQLYQKANANSRKKAASQSKKDQYMSTLFIRFLIGAGLLLVVVIFILVKLG